MILTQAEVGYISTIMDVYSYPFLKEVDAFSTPNEKAIIKRSLQEKEVIKENQLTKNGLQLLQVLHNTTTNEKYMIWNNIWIFEDQGSYIVIHVNTEKGIQIEQISKEAVLGMLMMGLYQTGEIEEKRRKIRAYPQERMAKYLREHEEIVPFFYEVVGRGSKNVGMVFVHDGYLHQYQSKYAKLYLLPKSKMYQTLEEIIGGIENDNGSES